MRIELGLAYYRGFPSPCMCELCPLACVNSHFLVNASLTDTSPLVGIKKKKKTLYMACDNLLFSHPSSPRICFLSSHGILEKRGPNMAHGIHFSCELYPTCHHVYVNSLTLLFLFGYLHAHKPHMQPIEYNEG